MITVGSRTRWLVALLAGILALPIVGVTAYLVYGVQQRIVVADSELAGLKQIVLYDAFFVDAEAYAHAVACRQHHENAAALRAHTDDALARLERSQTPGNTPPRWAKVKAAWSALRTSTSTDAPFEMLFEPLTTTFVDISDRSGLTFEPELIGIDLSDSLAYRLPRAMDQFASAHRSICIAVDPPTLADRFSVQRDNVRGQLLASDAFEDLDDAVRRDTTVSLAGVGIAYERARVLTNDTSERVAKFVASGSPSQHPGTEASLQQLTDAIQIVARTEFPAIDRMIALRIAGYHRDIFVDLIPGIIGILTAITVAILTTRLVWERAALHSAERLSAEHERIAMHDSLTGLLNRRAFFAALNGAATSGPNHGVLCILDVDDFKRINDTYGHPIGDDLLFRLSRIIEGAIRSTDVAARIGGDEFALFLRGPIDRAGTERVLATVALDAAAPMELRGHPIASSVSIGAAIIDDVTKLSVEDALAQADAALYRAKKSSRGGYVFYEPPKGA